MIHNYIYNNYYIHKYIYIATYIHTSIYILYMNDTYIIYPYNYTLHTIYIEMYTKYNRRNTTNKIQQIWVHMGYAKQYIMCKQCVSSAYIHTYIHNITYMQQKCNKSVCKL